MRLDPLGPDWSSLAPIAGFGAIERTAYGFRTSCEAGPIEVAAFAPGIFRLTLGMPSGPDLGILEASPAPQDNCSRGWFEAEDLPPPGRKENPVPLSSRRRLFRNTQEEGRL